MFVAFEGGEGAGKSTQVRLLAEWLTRMGREVMVTREPGGTALGERIRAMLLDVATGSIDARTEALLYAADRAEHVSGVIRPALSRGAVVVTDRYVDSSIAYQGSGRDLAAQDVVALSEWATDGLRPDLTVVLDIDPQQGLRRVHESWDRLEQEPLAFHERVRESFLHLAAEDPRRYLVVDAIEPAELVHEIIRNCVDELMS